MTFTRYNPSGYSDGQTLPAAAFNHVDLNQSRAIDGYAGGSYTATGRLTISSEVQLTDMYQCVVTSGNTFYVLSGGYMSCTGQLNITSTGSCRAVTGGTILIASGSYFQIQSGGTGTVQSGGALSVASGGALTVDSGGNANVAGDLNVQNGGDIEVQSGGDINVASGGSIVLASGGDITIADPDNVTFTAYSDSVLAHPAPFQYAFNWTSTYNAGVLYSVQGSSPTASTDFFIVEIPLSPEATVTSIRVQLEGAAGHAGEVGTFPKVQLIRVAITGAVTLIDERTDPETVAGNYESSHYFDLPAAPGSLDQALYYAGAKYFVRFYGEGGANALQGLRVYSIRVYYDLTQWGKV